MAGRGPKPAETHTRARNDRKTTKLVSDGVKRGFALPQLRNAAGKVVPWHTRTVSWWNAWRTSPQALQMMTEPDWEYLLVTARVHHEFWTSGRWELAAELRLREKEFGATPEARARLGVAVSIDLPGNDSAPTAPVGDAGNVTSIDPDRRRRVAAQA